MSCCCHFLTFDYTPRVKKKASENGSEARRHAQALVDPNAYRVLGSEDHQDVATVLAEMGMIHHKQGKHDEALEMYRKALEIFNRALGIDNPACDTASVHLHMSMARHSSGDKTGAVESARESVRIYSKPRRHQRGLTNGCKISEGSRGRRVNLVECTRHDHATM